MVLLLVVSLSVKNGISSVVLLDNGVVVKSSVKRCNTSEHSIEQLIDTFKRSILEVKPFVESGQTDKVTFEMNMRAVISGLKRVIHQRSLRKLL